ncbi:voltage-dependent calcium channel gamma-6 subunit-like [Anguilla rostrata]|uniref:voltage-dependent calcium channel gamma-6 subunit-like n=1 Tax=Anguilla anguilla TaxID=7936 RepID=UPI0015A931E7|nr:voltage-dependent calcium channel gamma-6 subunit-like [Anguilla anguilla]XP_035286896.1 voltage-dependent calcium channel gamma-6 subunit-like [Anguilla anguilla]
MWSTFYMQEEDGRGGGAGGGSSGLTGVMGMRGGMGKRRAAPTTPSTGQEGQVKTLFFVAVIGVALTILGLGTDYWVELAPPKTYYSNETCMVAHYGLWKRCLTTLWATDIDPERESCGPANLPGEIESNCTFFKFFTSGDNAVIFQKTTQKSLSVAAASLALLSLFLMVTAAVCIIMSLSKGEKFFLKPASVCFTLSGILVLLSLIVFHQSVLALLASDHTVPIHHELSWSASCIGISGAILTVAGLLFMLLTLPFSPWERCLPHDHSAT